jgi:hypothetical protein
MDDATQIQLRLIRELRDLLSAAGIEWWLFGGWAMDARAGSVTRDHSDIELFVWAEAAERVRAALTAAGYLAPPGLHPEEGQPFLRDGQEVGVWYVVRDASGQIVTPGRWADWPWPAGSFDAPPGHIENLELPAMSVEGLLDMKLGFARHPHGAPQRPRDAADIELLRRLLNTERH